MAGPVVQGDEGGYLGAAALLARGTGLLYRQSPFQPGYGVVLWPVERLTNDPALLYRAALVVNACALGSLVVVAYVVTGWLMDREAVGQRTAVAAIVAAYPPFLAYSNLTWELGLFVPVCALTAVAVARATARPTWQRWAVAGMAAGAAYALHTLGAVVVAAVLLLALLARRPTHEWLLASVGAAVGIELVGLPTVLLIRRLIEWDRHLAAAVGGSAVVNRYQAVVGLYNQNATVHSHGLLFVEEAAGQIWYLAVATAGLAVIGAVLSARACWRVFVRGSRVPADHVTAFAGLVSGLGLASSANRFIVGAGGSGQADALIYGRYNEHLLAPLLIVGAAHLVSRIGRWRDVLVWGAVIGAVIAGTGAVLVASRTAGALRAPIVYVNVIGLQPVLHAAGRIDVWPITGGAVLVVAAVLAATKWRGPAVSPAVLVVAGLAFGAYSARSMVTDSHARTQQRVVIHALTLVDRTAGQQRCIAVDAPVLAEWVTANDQTFRPRMEFKPFVSASDATPCSALVLTARTDLASSYPGARLMTRENYASPGLWVLRGPLQDRLAAAGLLLPPGFPAPLPANAYASSIAVVGPTPTRVRAGSALTFRVQVANRGRGGPWPSKRGFTAGDGWVSIAVGWSRVGSAPPSRASPLVGAARFQLLEPLWPGEHQTVALTPRAAIAGRPLAPGVYQVTVGLVQEGFSYFGDHGDRLLRFLVTVSPSAA
jgi:hypothetical protein